MAEHEGEQSPEQKRTIDGGSVVQRGAWRKRSLSIHE